jgi:hypothetical protein
MKINDFSLFFVCAIASQFSFLVFLKECTRVELSLGREMAARWREDGEGGGGSITRHGHEVEERKGGVRSRGRRRRKMGWGGKGGAAATGHPFKRARRGGGRSVGGTTRRRGVGRGVGASAVVERCGRQVGVLTGSTRASGARPMPKQGRRGTARWGPNTGGGI